MAKIQYGVKRDIILNYLRQFYGSPSTYWWDDDEGVTHEIVQGEGGFTGQQTSTFEVPTDQNTTKVPRERSGGGRSGGRG